MIRRTRIRHGFNTGVVEAVDLGWKLAAVLNGWAPEALLGKEHEDAFERAQRPPPLRRRNGVRDIVELVAAVILSSKDADFIASG